MLLQAVNHSVAWGWRRPDSLPAKDLLLHLADVDAHLVVVHDVETGSVLGFLLSCNIEPGPQYLPERLKAGMLANNTPIFKNLGLEFDHQIISFGKVPGLRMRHILQLNVHEELLLFPDRVLFLIKESPQLETVCRAQLSISAK